MPLLQCRDIRYSPGSVPVLEGVSLSVDTGERIGLVGTNGSGKSSLLRILSQEIEPDEGEVVFKRHARVAMVSQFLPSDLETTTVMDAVAEATDRHRAETLLAHLQLTGDALGQPAATLSGGEINRLLLARAVAAEPDVIFLDEPTNHLDVETVLLFQSFLVEYLRTAFLLVSHDRALLDTLTERTVFLRGGIARSFALPYSRARHELLEQEAEALERRAVQQKKIDSVRQSMERLAHWGHVYNNEKFARRARSMGKRISRMETDQQATPWADRRKLTMQGSIPRADRLLDVDDLTVSTPDGRVLLRARGFHVRRGDRIALLGVNGSGKTCFLAALDSAFATPSLSGVRFNPQVKLGYYDQELRTLNPESELIDAVRSHSDEPAARLRSALVGAGFEARDHDRRVASLSGGEKARLVFLVLQLLRPNLVLLDEPTNHVDVEGCEALEEELLASELTLLFVSHDRRFAENVANRYFRIQGGKLEEVPTLEHYFNELETAAGASTEGGKRRESKERSQPTQPETEDEILARILELEERLAADLARRKNRQQAKLQSAWKEEIGALYERLE